MTTEGPRLEWVAEVSGEKAESLWGLVSSAFTPLDFVSVMRQSPTKQEFLEVCANPEIHKAIAWDVSGGPLQLATVHTTVESLPWLDGAYLEKSFEPCIAKGVFRYLGMTAARRDGLWMGKAEFFDKLGEDFCSHGVAYDLGMDFTTANRALPRLTKMYLRRSLPGLYVEEDASTYYYVTDEDRCEQLDEVFDFEACDMQHCNVDVLARRADELGVNGEVTMVCSAARVSVDGLHCVETMTHAHIKSYISS